jgi:hypothetical protein
MEIALAYFHLFKVGKVVQHSTKSIKIKKKVKVSLTGREGP